MRSICQYGLGLRHIRKAGRWKTNILEHEDHYNRIYGMSMQTRIETYPQSGLNKRALSEVLARNMKWFSGTQTESLSRKINHEMVCGGLCWSLHHLALGLTNPGRGIISGHTPWRHITHASYWSATHRWVTEVKTDIRQKLMALNVCLHPKTTHSNKTRFHIPVWAVGNSVIS